MISLSQFINESILNESEWTIDGHFNFRMEKYEDKEYSPLTVEDFLNKVNKGKNIKIGYRISNADKCVILCETGPGSEKKEGFVISTLDKFKKEIANKYDEYVVYAYTGGVYLGIVHDASTNNNKGFIEYSPGNIKMKDIEF